MGVLRGPELRLGDADGPQKVQYLFLPLLAGQVLVQLERLGHQVWQDVRELTGGRVWDSQIQRAIRESDLMVALMSPHSTRSVQTGEGADSVCLDEISYALYSSTPRPVVPVMAVPCEPPLHLFRHNFLESVDEILVMDECRVVERGTHDVLIDRDGRYSHLWWEEMRTERYASEGSPKAPDRHPHPAQTPVRAPRRGPNDRRDAQ